MRTSARWLVICNFTIAATLAISSWESLRQSRESDEATARQAAVNLANALSIEVAAEIRLIENALATVVLSVARPNGELARELTIHRAVAEQRLLLPQVSALRFADAQGNVLAGLGPNEPATNVVARPYFAEAVNRESMVISEPLVSMVTGKWCIILARRLVAPDGSLHGVVYAVVTADHFLERFAQLDMGGSGAIALRKDSLRLIARYANSEAGASKGVGETVVSQELRRKLSENSEHGWYITPTALDNVERISAYQRVRGYPLLVFTGIATQEFLASWRDEALRHLSLVVFTLLVSSGFSLYMYRRQKSESQARSTAVKLNREQSLVLENDLVGMTRVRGRIIVWANKAAHRIFGYEEGAMVSRSTRMLYLDDESFEKVGKAYAALGPESHYTDQLQMRRKNGDGIWIDLRGAAVSEDETLWMLVDIDALKHSESRERHLALHDPLTGLANRRLMDAHLESTLATAKRADARLAVCYLDLDGFKQVNDAHGHDAGDQVLKVAAQRLVDTVRGNDIVARLGGDEFAVILTSVGGVEEAVGAMQRCLDFIRQPIKLKEGVEVTVGASMGIAIGNGDSDAAHLIRSADVAMYEAKRAGKGRIRTASPETLAAEELR